MNIDTENPATPTLGEAMADAILDAAEGSHDCGTCEWCVATAHAVAAMVPWTSPTPF